MTEIRDYLVEQLKSGASTSKGYVDQMNEAKTTLKSKYYKKKLKKANKRNADLIMAIQRLEEIEEKENEHAPDDSK